MTKSGKTKRKTGRPAGVEFLDGGGEMGRCLRSFDWPKHPLGKPGKWPQALKTAVRLMLTTNHPVFIFWGPKHYCFYNDAYSASIGPEKHPAMLGAPGRKMWKEIWPIIGPQIRHVMAGKGATWHEDHLVPIIRHGKLDEVYWTYSYSPVDSAGAVGGVLVICTETTQRVLTDRLQIHERDRLQLMFQQAPSFMAMLRGADHRIEMGNAAYMRLTGHREVIGKTVAEALPEAAAQGYVDLLDRVYQSGEAYTSTGAKYVVPASSTGPSEERFIDFVYQPLTGEAGAVTGIFVEGHDVTDRMQTDKALRESEQLLRAISEFSGEMIYAKDRNGRLLYGNPALVAVIGKPLQTLLGRNESEWHDNPEEAARIRANDEAVMSVGKVQRVNEMFTGADGKHFICRSTKAPIRDQNGNVVGLVGISVDVTKHEKANDALRENESRLRFFDDLARDILPVTDADAILMITARALATHVGVEICAYADVDDDEDAFTIRGEWNAAGAVRLVGRHRLRSFGATAYNRLRAGETFIATDVAAELGADEARPFLALGVQATVSLPLIKNGGLTALMAVHSARPRRWTKAEIALITETVQRSWAHVERARADAALRKLNETLERRVAEALAERKVLADIVEGTDAFVQVADLQFRWLAINRAAADEFERIFGVRPKVGDSMLDLLVNQPENRAAVKEVWSRALAGEEFTETAEFGDPTRDRRFYEMKYNSLRGAKGERIGAYQFVYDVTDRLREQERLREAEEQLRQTQKLEAIGQLTGGVAHDFNNLLMVISGGLNLLGRSPDEAKREMLMVRMREAVDRGATLTKQLLAFSRRHELKPEHIELGEYLAGMNDLLNRSLGVNVRVDIDVPPEAWPVHADPHALQLAILNLAVNARDAMPEGGKVVIAARNGSPDKPEALCVRISVSDTGTGMTPEVRAKIFEPFFTTKEIGKGSGLGLAQVHGFAKQSGGHVEVESELGRGTTFIVVLQRSDAETKRTVNTRASLSRAPPDKRQAGNALLVEDDQEVAALTTEMLEHMGWRVTRVASAEAALGALADGREINLVFSDVMMPGGQNGIELARVIRERRPGLPIVLASGYSEAVRAEATASGVPLLPKPFSLDTLAAIIEVAQVGTRNSSIH